VLIAILIDEPVDEKSRNELFSRPRTGTKSASGPTTGNAGPSTPTTTTNPTPGASASGSALASAPLPAAGTSAPVAPSPEKTGIKAISLDTFKLKPKQFNFKASPLAFDRRDKAEKPKVEKDPAKKVDDSAEKNELLAGGKVRDSLLNDDEDMEVDIDAQLDSVLGNIDVTQEEVLFEDVDGTPLIILFYFYFYFFLSFFFSFFIF
jgi:hypothetical protein